MPGLFSLWLPRRRLPPAFAGAGLIATRSALPDGTEPRSARCRSFAPDNIAASQISTIAAGE